MWSSGLYGHKNITLEAFFSKKTTMEMMANQGTLLISIIENFTFESSSDVDCTDK